MEHVIRKITKLHYDSKNRNNNLSNLVQKMHKNNNKMSEKINKLSKRMEKLGKADKYNNLHGGAETEGATFMSDDFFQKTDTSSNSQTVTSGVGTHPYSYPSSADNSNKTGSFFTSEPASVSSSSYMNSYPMTQLGMKMAPGQKKFTMEGGVFKHKNK